MGKLLINNLKLHKHTFLILALCIICLFLVGAGMLCLILGLDDTAVSWFGLGGILAGTGLVFFAVMCFLSYYQDFMLALSLGRTRREFMLYYALEQLLWLIIGYALLLLLAWFETLLYPAIFPNIYEEFSILPFLLNWYVVPILLVLVIVQMFFGALYSRFGKKFGMILYIVWISACIFIPRLVSHIDALNPSIQRWFTWLFSMPPLGWLVTGLIAAGVMVTVTIRLGIKQMVH